MSNFALRVIGHIFGGNSRQRLFLVDCGYLFRFVREIVQIFELKERDSPTWCPSRVNGSRVDKNSRLSILYFGAVEIECDVYSCTLCVQYFMIKFSKGMRDLDCGGTYTVSGCV